jgi:hypothetical protein
VKVLGEIFSIRNGYTNFIIISKIITQVKGTGTYFWLNRPSCGVQQ